MDAAFVDTGFLLAFVLPGDSLHGRARRWMRVISRFVTTDYVIWEFANHLAADSDRHLVPPIVQLVRTDPAITLVRATPTLTDAGLAYYERRLDKGWSLTDCVSFEVMREQGLLHALTFDHHFEQAGFEALLRRDPP